MTSRPRDPGTPAPAAAAAQLEADVREARAGNRHALERVVAAIQHRLFGLALRMLWHPQDAEDATQEIMIRIITRIGSFRGESGFMTWCYRVASNYLLDAKRGRMELPLTFAGFGADLDEGLAEAPPAGVHPVEQALLLEEVKIGCTLGMLLCLDRAQRLAYILGEILALDHREAAAVLSIAPAAFRKRLSRAREEVVAFTRAKCGLVNPDNPCRCSKRVAPAIARGRVDPGHLLHATSMDAAGKFPAVLREIRRLDALQRAVALYRSHPEPHSGANPIAQLRELLERRMESADSPVTPRHGR
jgi:RNA polymerase sigma factor (sigma-70 family)